MFVVRARVVTIGALARLDGVHDNRGIFASVLDDLTQGLFDGARQDANADRLVSACRLRVPPMDVLSRLPRQALKAMACRASQCRMAQARSKKVAERVARRY
jgi:hypothetical protein